MKPSFALLIVAVIAGAVQAAPAADISGQIILEGTPPPEQEIPQVKDDPYCGKLHTEPVKTRFYVVGSKGELADVFVTLKGIKGQSTGASAAPAVLDQRGCEYLPYVLAIQTQQKMLVKNSDPLMHNIHPTPAVPGNKEENRAQMPNGPDLTFTFPKAETFLRLKCDVHQWMFAYVSVVDHPYFAVSDKTGRYTIKDVPPGKYTVEAYHRKAAPLSAPATKQIDLKGDNVTADFKLEAR
jgi:hypothetical protein